MPPATGTSSTFSPRNVALYGSMSTSAALAVVVSAFRQRPNYYSAAVMLGRSNGCMLVLLNFGVFLAFVFGKACQKVFFGNLRTVEVEHIYERSWYAVTESLLAMTIFRDDFDASFVILFGTLLFLKVFHWLSADRVEFMEQSPSVSRLFHCRMISILWTLFFMDLFLVAFAVEVLIIDKHRMGIMIMFASEFMILSATLWSTIAKYIINCQDMRSEEPWEAKSMYVFFVDLVTDFLKLATYLAFFTLILSYYGLPLNIIRDVYMTGRSFFGRIRDFVKYRAATRNMDTRFPDASHEDMRTMSDGTCIICRDDMVVRGVGAGAGAGAGAGVAHRQENVEGNAPNAAPSPQQGSSSGLNETPKKLPCGHIFHFHCLRSWLERQQSCPTCRRTVFETATAAQPQPANAAIPPEVATRHPAARAGGGATAATAAANNTRGGGQPAYDESDLVNPGLSPRDRLQSFLQQLQGDVKKVREERERPFSEGSKMISQRRANAKASTSSLQDGQAPSSSSRPSRSGTPPGKKTEKETGSSSSLASNATPSAGGRRKEASRQAINSLFAPTGMSHGGSRSDLERGTDFGPSWIPPPPWTFRNRGSRTNESVTSASRRNQGGERSGSPSVRGARDGEDESNEKEVNGSSSSTLPSAESSQDDKGKQKHREKEESHDEKGEKSTTEPADAREAARAAALKRFAALSRPSNAQCRDGSRSVTSPVEIGSSSGSSGPNVSSTLANEVSPTQEKSGPSKAAEAVNGDSVYKLPGDPHLIPLFESSRIPNFESIYQEALPFPLAVAADDVARAGSPSAISANLTNGSLLASMALDETSKVSEEELRKLSSRSRQGLEEQLRLLERVQGTIWTTVQELTRALSVIPGEEEGEEEKETRGFVGHGGGDETDERSSGSGSSSNINSGKKERDKGKGKERERERQEE